MLVKAKRTIQNRQYRQHWAQDMERRKNMPNKRKTKKPKTKTNKKKQKKNTPPKKKQVNNKKNPN